MEAKGFIGGKYVEPVQVIAGDVQTFTARHAATGRPVYVHQITETARPEQTTLLKLLLLCLYRVPAVKERVLDISDEGDTYFVVTESNPAYLVLREWLQREWDKADGGGIQAPGVANPAGENRSEMREEAIRNAVQRPTPPPQSSMRPQPQPAPGVQRPAPPVNKSPADSAEFTRLFQQVDFARPAAAPPSGNVQRPGQGSAKSNPSPQPDPSRKPALPNGPDSAQQSGEVGEFTRLFSDAPQGSKQPPNDRVIQSAPMRPVNPVAPAPAAGGSAQNPLAGPSRFTADEGTEHTNLFKTPPPIATREQPKNVQADRAKSPDPMTPLTAPPFKDPQRPGNTPGEFTELFNAGPKLPNSGPAQTGQKPAPSPDSHPLSTSKGQPGEFTQFFSSEGQGLNRPFSGSSAPGAQRPSPISAVPSHSNSVSPDGSPGEFTQLFSAPPGNERRSAPPPPSLGFNNTSSVPGDPFRNPHNQPRSGSSGDFNRMFGDGSESAQPSGAGAGKEDGEYTKLFGSPGSVAATPQSQKAPGARSSFPSLNEPGPGAASGAPVKGTGPGDFTQVIGRPSTGQASGPSGAPPSAGPAGGSPAVQFNMNPQLPTVPQIPHVPAAGPLGSASVAGPSVTPPSASAAGVHPPSMSAPHGPVSAAPQMPAPPPVPPQVAPAAAASKPRTALFVVFAILLILAIALVVLIMMNR